MIRSLAASIWVVAATLAAVYFGHAMQNPRSAPASEPAAKAPTAVKLQAMTVPVVAGGAVQGYVLTQVSVATKPEHLKGLPQPPDLLLADETFKTLYNEEQIDFTHIERLDLSRLSQKIRENINSRAGAPVAEDVFIQELHYMSKKEAGASVGTPR